MIVLKKSGLKLAWRSSRAGLAAVSRTRLSPLAPTRSAASSATESGGDGPKKTPEEGSPKAEEPEVEMLQLEKKSSGSAATAVGALALLGGGGAALYYWYSQSQSSPATDVAAKKVPERTATPIVQEAAVPTQSPEEIAAAQAAEAERQREAAALQRQREEEAEAERKEKEARRVSLLADLESALQGANQHAVEALAVALQAAQTEGLVDDIVSAAEARLSSLRKAKECLEIMGDSEQQIKAALVERSSRPIRVALEAYAAAAEALSGTGERAPPESEVIAKAQVEVLVIERLEVEAVRRQAALAGLEDAINSRDAKSCEAAVKEAVDAGVDPCPELETARILSDPTKLHEVLAQVSADRIASIRHSGRVKGVCLEDFVESAKAEVASMSEDALRDRAAYLARALVSHNLLAMEELAQEIDEAEAELADRCANRAEVAAKNFTQDFNAAAEATRKKMIEEAQQRTEEAVLSVREQVHQESEKHRAAARAEAEAEVAAQLNAEAERFAIRRRGLLSPVEGVQKIFLEGQTPDQRSKAASLFASAVMHLESQLLTGKPCHEALKAVQAHDDDFLQTLMRSIPAEVIASSNKVSPTAAQLRNDFQSKLPQLVSAALAPPAEGLLGKLVSSVIGNALARMYYIGALPAKKTTSSEEDGATAKAERNLEALGRAAHIIDQGKLVDGVDMLQDSLKGPCHAQAQAWIHKTRFALLLSQTVQAVHGEACVGLAAA